MGGVLVLFENRKRPMQTRQRQIGCGGCGARRIVALLALLGFGFCAQAQTYSIDWYKVSGGGGTSTGGVYTASGTIGQPDAGGSMSGGNYSLTGGFWSLIAVVQTPGAPTLDVVRSGSNVTVSWPYPSTGWALEQNESVTTVAGWQTSGYTVSTNATLNSITVTAPTRSLFFRLHKP
jgi:hypothetical protein